MSLIAGETVLIHVHKGTMISSWSFTTAEAKEAFEAAHRSHLMWDPYGNDGLRHLPDGTFDDPDTDTWIEVEGSMIEYVDGERPLDGNLLVEHEEAFGDEHDQSCPWCDAALGD